MGYLNGRKLWIEHEGFRHTLKPVAQALIGKSIGVGTNITRVVRQWKVDSKHDGQEEDQVDADC